jgi:hypothetical protein
MERTLKSLPKFSGKCNDARFLVGSMIHLPQICLNFLDFFHRLGDKEILWGKRNFGDCKRVFEQAIVEALSPSDETRTTFTCATPLFHVKILRTRYTSATGLSQAFYQVATRL